MNKASSLYGKSLYDLAKEEHLEKEILEEMEYLPVRTENPIRNTSGGKSGLLFSSGRAFHSQEGEIISFGSSLCNGTATLFIEFFEVAFGKGSGKRL